MKGLIKETGDGYAIVYVPLKCDYIIEQQGITECEVKFSDGRTISPEQRRKAYALINDIATWSGHAQEFLKEWMKYRIIAETGCEYFSLSDCSMSQAREYISYLIEFCLKYNIPVTDTLLNRNDDIGRYLYACLIHKKCAICNAAAEVHHVDRIGMGNNRDDIIHEGMEAVALCRKHHMEAHSDEKTLFYTYKIYGIKLDAYLCGRLKLTKERNQDSE